MPTEDIGLSDHPEHVNSGNRYFNFDNRIPLDPIAPRDAKTEPYQGPYDLTDHDLLGLAIYANTLVNGDLLKYNPVVACQDALSMAMRDKDNGKFDHKLNDSTYQIVLSYLAGLRKIKTETLFDLRLAKKETPKKAPKKEEKAPKKEETVTLQKKRFPGQSEEVTKTELRKVLQGKPSKELTIHKKKELGIQASEEGTMTTKYASVTQQLDKVASSLEASNDPELLRLALEIDRVSDDLEGASKSAAAVESDKDEAYMKNHFKDGVIEQAPGESHLKPFNVDKSEEVEKVKTQKGGIRNASLPYQKISE